MTTQSEKESNVKQLGHLPYGGCPKAVLFFICSQNSCFAFLLRHHVHVQVVVGHLHAVSGEGVAQHLIHLEIGRPVVLRRRPAADGVLDGACAVVREIHRRRGIGEHGGEGGDSVHAGALHVLGRRVVGRGDLVDDAAAAKKRKIDDLRAGHFTVGLQDDLPVGRFDLRVRQ